jgi:hypothetical protein
VHTALNLPFVYDYVIKLCRQEEEVIENIRGLNLAVDKLTTVQVNKLPTHGRGQQVLSLTVHE